MKDRFTNVIYLLSLIIAVGFIAFIPIAYLDMIKRWGVGYSLFISLAFPLGYATASFVIGWSIRYILVGTKSLRPQL